MKTVPLRFAAIAGYAPAVWRLLDNSAVARLLTAVLTRRRGYLAHQHGMPPPAAMVRNLEDLLWLKKNLHVAGAISRDRAFTGPRTVQIDITNACNLRCLTCWFNSPEANPPAPGWRQQRLDYGRFTELIDFFAAAGTQRVIIISDGEPFTHPRIMQMIHYVKQQGMYCCVYTNGTLLTQEIVDQLLEWRLDRLAVNVWAGSAAQYVELHPGQEPEMFHQLVGMLKYFTARKKKVRRTSELYLINVICNRNYHSLDEMLHLAQTAGGDILEFQLADVSDKRLHYDLTPEQLSAAIAIVKELQTRCAGRNLPVNFAYFLNQLEDRKRRHEQPQRQGDDRAMARHPVNAIPCYYGWLFARVKVDGSVIPCCPCWSFPLGSLERQSMGEIWYSPRWNQFRVNASQTNNKHGDYFSSCHCVDFCVHYDENLAFHQIMNRVTAYQRRLIESVLPAADSGLPGRACS